ncbi:hypothetical protein BaRGS_00001338 [Batillaria attramentaria]|uniref:Multiple inositol polyphosphate phosphatase 1 n=1 Tax=Batillaria attramentaria TaxID=370345 RepID=A0ABD0M7D7_9CAEN
MAATWSSSGLILLLGLVLFDSPPRTDAFKYFSTKTPYAWGHSVAETDLEDKLFNENAENLMCSAVHTSIVARHGTRFPGVDDVVQLSEIHAKIKNEHVKENYPDLYSWKNPFPDNNRKALSDLGEKELIDFGTRTAQRLFSLFAEEDSDSFRYIISSTDRTRDSSRAFYEGLTGVLSEDGDETEEDYEPEIIDKLLRFHTLCDKYVKSVGDNKTALKEYYSFQEGELLGSTKKKVSEKLGIAEDVLSAGEIRTVFLMCGYEAAIFKSSPWCQLLDEKDMRALEYLGDLKHYYKNGPGYEINWKQACPLVADIFYTMDDAIDALESMDGSDEDDGYIIGQFAFGHAETLGPLYTSFGLFNDTEPLRADNFQKQEQRQFRTSHILPFGANLQLILYECEPPEQYLNPDEDFEHNPDYYLKLLVNEEAQRIPGCDSDLCSYASVRSRLKDQIDGCNFVQTCRVRTKDEL